MNPAAAWLEFPVDHPALAGHFPGEPIVPGALLLDEALHAVARQGRRWRIASVKFHRIVRPLEPLQLECLEGPAGDLQLTIRSAAGPAMTALLEPASP